MPQRNIIISLSDPTSPNMPAPMWHRKINIGKVIKMFWALPNPQPESWLWQDNSPSLHIKRAWLHWFHYIKVDWANGKSISHCWQCHREALSSLLRSMSSREHHCTRTKSSSSTKPTEKQSHIADNATEEHFHQPVWPHKSQHACIDMTPQNYTLAK